MPQASDELRGEMYRLFGDSIDDAGPIKYLEDSGYTALPSWEWKPKPGVKTLQDMTQDEYLCLLFLIDEWDWGGLVKEPA